MVNHAFSPLSNIDTEIMGKILLCGKERAVRMGDVGFSTNFTDIQDIVAMHQDVHMHASEEDLLTAVDESTVEETMQETHQATVSLALNDKWLKANKQAIGAVNAELDQRLARAGFSHEKLQKLDSRIKFKYAIELSAPQPPPNYVMILVHIEKRLESVNLPLKATFNMGHDILHGFVKGSCLARCNETGENPQALDGQGLGWYYQLLSRDKKKGTLLPSSRALDSEDEWKEMMGIITGNGDGPTKDLPVAVLTRTLPASKD